MRCTCCRTASRSRIGAGLARWTREPHSAFASATSRATFPGSGFGVEEPQPPNATSAASPAASNSVLPAIVACTCCGANDPSGSASSTKGIRRSASVDVVELERRHAEHLMTPCSPAACYVPLGGGDRRFARDRGRNLLVAVDRRHEIPADAQGLVDLPFDLLGELWVRVEVRLGSGAPLAEAVLAIREERARL